MSKKGEWITTTEAAAICGCHQGYLYRVVKSGALESRLVEGRRFILRSSLEKWLSGYAIRRHVKTETLQEIGV